jgi:hypothetical protein
VSDHSHGAPNTAGSNGWEVPPNQREIISKGKIEIKDNVWLGNGVCVLANVSIGEGAIVGANSVVLSDIPLGQYGPEYPPIKLAQAYSINTHHEKLHRHHRICKLFGIRQNTRGIVKGTCPGKRVPVACVDRPTEEIKRAVTRSGIQAQYAQDLGIPDFEHLAFKYQLVEFNTALKPTFLKSIFSEGFDSVIYLDPDIKVFSALSPVLNALSSSDIVLTPHSTRPVLMDCGHRILTT